MITKRTVWFVSIRLAFFPVTGDASMCFPDLISKCIILLGNELIAENTAPDIRYLGIKSLNRKELKSLVWHLKAISNLGQVKVPLNPCCNLVLVCNNITTKCGSTATKHFFSTVGTFSLTK